MIQWCKQFSPTEQQHVMCVLTSGRPTLALLAKVDNMMVDGWCKWLGSLWQKLEVSSGGSAAKQMQIIGRRLQIAVLLRICRRTKKNQQKNSIRSNDRREKRFGMHNIVRSLWCLICIYILSTNRVYIFKCLTVFWKKKCHKNASLLFVVAPFYINLQRAKRQVHQSRRSLRDHCIFNTNQIMPPPRHNNSNNNSNAVHGLTDVLVVVQERRTESMQSMQQVHDSTSQWLMESIQVRFMLYVVVLQSVITS